MMRAEKLIQIIKSAKLTGGVDDPPAWQIEKTRFQSTLCRILLLPIGGLLVAVMKYIRGYRIENMAAIRGQFKAIWQEKEREDYPLVICSNHLTFIDSALIIWALASNYWYFFNYRAFTWNVPAGDFFKKKLHYHTILYLTKCIFIDRKGSPAHKNAVLNLCRYLLAKGNVVLIFPEGQRSREGKFDVDRLRFGTGKILTSLEEARVLCVYIRSPLQKVFSNYPPKGSRFRLYMKLIKPNVDGLSKKQSSITAVKEIGTVIEQMENEFFAAHERENHLE
ncbi:MAG: lysophospholipid acyltransferase family protein [Pyrinomonadaceae bacterium]